MAAAVEIGVQSLVKRCKTPLDRAQQEYVEVAIEGGVAERNHVPVAWEGRDAVDPLFRRDELELRFQDNSCRSPGVKYKTHIIARESENARILFDRHDLQRLDHARIANDAVTNGADARKAAAEIAADGRNLHGRGIHHELLSARQRGRERRLNEGSRLHADSAGFHPNNPVVTGHVETMPPLSGTRLTIISRTAAA